MYEKRLLTKEEAESLFKAGGTNIKTMEQRVKEATKHKSMLEAIQDNDDETLREIRERSAKGELVRIM